MRQKFEEILPTDGRINKWTDINSVSVRPKNCFSLFLNNATTMSNFDVETIQTMFEAEAHLMHHEVARTKRLYSATIICEKASFSNVSRF